MKSVLNILAKDFTQMLRDWKTFLFLLIMPIAFTFLFGFAFGGAGEKDQDMRLPVGVINQDGQTMESNQLMALLNGSTVIRMVEFETEEPLIKALDDEKTAAALIIPQGFGASLRESQPKQLNLALDPSSSAGMSVQTEVGMLTNRLLRSILSAEILAQEGGLNYEEYLLNNLERWKNPPVKLAMAQNNSTVEQSESSTNGTSAFAHSSPGMILQFAIAGLITCATVVITERKTRCLQRMLTTATSRAQILLGHYLAIFLLIFAQFSLLILFGDLVLKLNYLDKSLATLAITLSAALCISALGLFIGMLAKGEEQAVAFAMVCMFVFSGLGGAWVPLEFTGKVFQAIGHFTPVAWAMDGYKNILLRGLGLEAAWLPAVILLGYGLVFFGLAVWKFRTE